MSKRKLLFVTPSRSNAGTNSSLSSIYNSLKEEFDFTVLTLTCEGNATYEFLCRAVSIPAVNAYYGNYRDLSGLAKLLAFYVKFLKHLSILLQIHIDLAYLSRKVRRFESKHEFDCVVGFQEGQASLVASLFSNPNKIAWIHSDIERAGKPSTEELEMCSRFKTIVCVSQFTKDKFVARYPQLKDKVQYIYNLVDYKRILDLSVMPIDDSRFANDVFSIVSAGRMDTVKQFPYIPQIAAELKKQGCRFRWYILGGPENDEFRNVEKSIDGNGVKSEVILLGNKTNPYPYFRNSNLYVSTSWSEACPMVFIEAKLCGIPIVTNNFGSSSEFVENNVNGYIETIDNLWQPIAKMITDKGTYQRIKAVCDTYKIDNSSIMKQLKNLFSL